MTGNCPECNQVAFFVVKRYPLTLECLCCHCQWQFVEPTPEDEDDFQRLDRQIAAGRNRISRLYVLASELNKDHPALTRSAEHLIDVLMECIRALESTRQILRRIRHWR